MKTPRLVSCTFTFCILYPIAIGFTFCISSCSFQHQISRSAKQVINDSALQTAQVGISIYEPEAGKYWYNYNGEKYFVPASNTKIATCYAAMKYLGDSLVGLRYRIGDSSYYFSFTGDPTFLHPDFSFQPVFEFLKSHPFSKSLIIDENWKEEGLGSGWGWSDYNEYYMAERSGFPIYGNVVRFKEMPGTKTLTDSLILSFPRDIIVSPSFFADSTTEKPTRRYQYPPPSDVVRSKYANKFTAIYNSSAFPQKEIPFITYGNHMGVKLLKDTLRREIDFYFGLNGFSIDGFNVIHTQPTDSLLKPMMHRSDNFFAEQSLLMVSNERLGVMNDEKIIDTLLNTVFKEIPQKPRWVDGCGLSRYNLFSPQDFVFILNKMQQEFGMGRMKVILPTGGEGTLSNYYIADKGYIYAKTGSLSGVLCLSGYIYTKKNKLLIFSVLVNNHRASPSSIRRVVEKFIQELRRKY